MLDYYNLYLIKSKALTNIYKYDKVSQKLF
jgi:hypothetical protein